MKGQFFLFSDAKISAKFQQGHPGRGHLIEVG